MLALFSILCQKKLIKALNLPNLVIVLFNVTAGILLSVNTFLPSTFSMNFIMLAFAYFLNFYKTSNYLSLFLSLLCCSLAMVVGWPFVALVFASFALPYMIKFPKFLLTPKLYIYGISALALTIIPSLVLDSYFYKRPVLSFLNLFLYNTSIGKNLVGSSVLFGIDP